MCVCVISPTGVQSHCKSWPLGLRGPQATARAVGGSFVELGEVTIPIVEVWSGVVRMCGIVIVLSSTCYLVNLTS